MAQALMAQPKNGPLREALKAALGKDGKNSDGGDDDEASADGEDSYDSDDGEVLAPRKKLGPQPGPPSAGGAHDMLL